MIHRARHHGTEQTTTACGLVLEPPEYPEPWKCATWGPTVTCSACQQMVNSGKQCQPLEGLAKMNAID